MKNKLIAITTAGAIALSGLTAAPAQAGSSDELARLLFGAAIIGIIVNEANNNAHVTVTKNKPHRNKKKRHHAHKKQKPRQCLRQRWTNHGWKKYFAKRCMAKHGWERHGNKGWHTHRRHAHQ
ncbi:MAG: hypothetical protein ACI861_001500 [Paracoccaceae bacterium]|jgi:hypothetical protein